MIKRRDLSAAKNEFTTQKLRQEWAEHEQESLMHSIADSDVAESAGPEQQCDRTCDSSSAEQTTVKTVGKQASFVIAECDGSEARDDSKQQKKKRRKRSIMRKKSSVISSSATFPQLHGAQRKDSSSSANSAVDCSGSYNDAEETDPDLSFATLSNQTTASTPNLSPNVDQMVPNEENACKKSLNDFHFFSDTEARDCREHGRPSTPIKSDSEIEMTRTKASDDVMTNSASWKWGELPTPLPLDEQQQGPISDDAKQAQRISMISNVFNFMKQSKGMRNNAATANPEGIYLSDLDVGGLDPEVEALYFPPISPINHADNDDHESGNGTSLPHSPSSIESPKSCDSDYEEGKNNEKWVARASWHWSRIN